MTEQRIPIERIEADGTVTQGTARMSGVTIDDFRSVKGSPLELPPGARFVISVTVKDTP